jgi:hypothetical protein
MLYLVRLININKKRLRCPKAFLVIQGRTASNFFNNVPAYGHNADASIIIILGGAGKKVDFTAGGSWRWQFRL